MAFFRFTLRIVRNRSVALLLATVLVIIFVNLQLLMMAWDESISTPTALPLRMAAVRIPKPLPNVEDDPDVVSNKVQLIKKAAVIENPVSLALIRSIGNALPPGRDVSTTMVNLNFTLQHEKLYPNTVRHWFVNKIANPYIEERVIETLKLYNESFTHIPIDLDEYSKIPYHFERQQFRFTTNPDPTLKGAHHEKAVFAIDVNGARNAMLKFGKEKTQADYILPWDGNCFLTQKGWERIQKAIKRHTDDRYFFVAMDRVKSNDKVLDANYKPFGTEEPQIVFHRKSRATFNSYLRYNHNSKVELLKRIRRVPMEWTAPWEESYAKLHSSDVTDHIRGENNVTRIQWVTRLSSGQPDAEDPEMQKEQAVYDLLRRLDSRASKEGKGLRRDALLANSGTRLKKVDGENMDPLTQNIVAVADQFLANPDWLRTDPSTTLVPLKLQAGVIALTLAHNFTGSTSYANAVSESLISFISVKRERTHFDKLPQHYVVSMMKMAPAFLDAMKILKSTKLVPREVSHDITDWFSYDGWGNEIASDEGVGGMLFDVYRAATSVFNGRYGLTTVLLHRAMERMNRKVDNMGRIDMRKGFHCEKDLLVALQGYVVLARLAKTWLGYDLFLRNYADIRDSSVNSPRRSKLCLALESGNPLYQAGTVCGRVGQFKDAWEELEMFSVEYCPSFPQREHVQEQSWFSDVIEFAFSAREAFNDLPEQRLLLV